VVRTVEGHLLTMARPLADSFGLAPLQLGACQLRSCFRSSIASGGLPRRRGLARFLVVSVFVLLVRGLATSLCYGRFSLSPLCFAHSRTSDSRSGISP